MKIILRPDDRLRTKVMSLFATGGHPGAQSTFCGAHSGMYVIDRFGDLYACWERTGNDKIRTGKINRMHGGDGDRDRGHVAQPNGDLEPGLQAMPHGAFSGCRGITEAYCSRGKSRCRARLRRKTRQPRRWCETTWP